MSKSIALRYNSSVFFDVFCSRHSQTMNSNYFISENARLQVHGIKVRLYPSASVYFYKTSQALHARGLRGIYCLVYIWFLAFFYLFSCSLQTEIGSKVHVFVCSLSLSLVLPLLVGFILCSVEPNVCAFVSLFFQIVRAFDVLSGWDVPEPFKRLSFTYEVFNHLIKQ